MTQEPANTGADGRCTVVLAANLLTLGGIEKGMMNDALKLPRDRWDVRVVGVWGLGDRAPLFEQAGFTVGNAERDLDRLVALFRGADVVHVHRQGITEPMVPAAARAAGIPVLIETNVMGQVDRSPDRDQFDCHLFVSKFCLMRYRNFIRDSSPDFHVRHRTQRHGLDLETLRDRLPPKKEAKRALGLDPARPVVGRIGRAADGKWRDLLVDMVPRLINLVPEVQLMFVGATPAKEARLRRLGVLDRCLLPQPTLDDDRLAAYYAACDVYVTAAEIGEAGSVALMEAMACGAPVVTCSTPWADNCQIEFVDHGRSGYIANHPRTFAEAVAELLTDDARRVAFGDAARADIESIARYQPGQLAHLYEEMIAGNPQPEAWTPSPAEVDAFPAEYEQRLRREYGRLKLRERAWMRWVRARERRREVMRFLSAKLDRQALKAVWQRFAWTVRRRHPEAR